MPHEQRKNLFLYETQEVKAELTSFSHVFAVFLVTEGERMRRRALLSKQKGKNYTTLGEVCHMISERKDQLEFVEVCRVLKIVIIVTGELACKHRFVAKGIPKSKIKLTEFMEENAGFLDALGVYDAEGCGVRSSQKGRNISTLTPASCFETLINGIIPTVS